MEDYTEQLWPQNPRIHVILRALGFRPPHRAFLTEFRLDMYKDIRKSLAASILHYQPERFTEIRKANTEADGTASTFAKNMVATDALTNFFRYRRELLDSAGFVIFPDLFNSVTSIDKSLVWPSMNSTMDNDVLYRSGEA